MPNVSSYQYKVRAYLGLGNTSMPRGIYRWQTSQRMFATSLPCAPQSLIKPGFSSQETDIERKLRVSHCLGFCFEFLTHVLSFSFPLKGRDYCSEEEDIT